MNRVGKAVARVAAGMLLLTGVVVFADIEALFLLLKDATLGWLLGGLLVAILSNLLSALRWRTIANFLGCLVSYPQALRWYFQGIGLNALLPGAVVGGDLYRVIALRRNGQPTTEAAWSVFFDRLSGLWMLCLIGSVGAALSAIQLSNALGLSYAWITTMAIALGLILMLTPILFIWWLRQSIFLKWQWLVSLKSIVTHRAFFQQFLIQALSSAGVQLLSAAALAAGGLALGVSLNGAAWAFAIAPIFLMAALPVSIGGWGTREAAAILAFAPFEVSPAVAVGVALIYGVFGLIQALFGAFSFGLPASETDTKV